MPDIAGFASLGENINKQNMEDVEKDTKQGVVSEKLPELTLDMKDDDLIDLTKKWKKAWDESPVKADFVMRGEENEEYWLGEHHDLPKSRVRATKGKRPDTDNLIFESLETFLPQATRRNPEPMVSLHSSEKKEGEDTTIKDKFVQKVKDRLADLADTTMVRLKLKKATRHWAIYLLGILKFGWDLDNDTPTARVIRPSKIILDPAATIDEDGYTGQYVGEIVKREGATLLSIIGNGDGAKGAKKTINDLLEKDEKGTTIQFIEWWTPEFMVWTLGKHILLKKKNPNWNYDEELETPETTTKVDTFGVETEVEAEPKKAINHLSTPKIPYGFLSIFNLGDQPVDKTSLIGQNLSNQDRINRRNRQIDKNVKTMNNGLVVSLGRSGLSQSQAEGVAKALRKGGVVTIPDGSPRDAVDRPQVTGLPNDVFNDLVDTRSRLRDIFGTRGSTPAGIEKEKTVRGKILSRGFDADRIGGGISEYLEQLSDLQYNWYVQLLYVYDSDFQFLGDATPPKLKVSVKEGSLLPKDSTTIANQAIELGSAGMMSKKDMYERLEYPDPEGLAANVWLEANAPQLLFSNNPLVQQALGMQQQAAQAAQQQEIQKEQIKAQPKPKQGKEEGGGSLLAAVPVDAPAIP